MPMSLNGTKHMYTVIARLYRMFYMEFHTRRINMPMSLNETEHIYIYIVTVHMTFYKASYLDVLGYMYFSKVWKYSYLCIPEF
jgi:hypothetical protein